MTAVIMRLSAKSATITHLEKKTGTIAKQSGLSATISRVG